MTCGARLRSIFLCCAAGLSLAGCGWWNQAEETEEVEGSTVTELVEDVPPATASASHARHAERHGHASAPPAQSASRPDRPGAPGESITLVKTVSQQLQQQDANGRVDSRSFVELTMMITPVDTPALTGGSTTTDGRGGPGRYRVVYRRARVFQEIPGQSSISYDSDAPPSVIPFAARPYQELRDNGFEFSLDRDGQLLAMHGFEPFLERCLSPFPVEQRGGIRAALSLTSPASALAYFVDDSIGMIPAEVNQAGDSWLRSRTQTQPLAVTTDVRCTVRQLTGGVAELELVGAIRPAEAPATSSESSPEGMQVVARGGKLLGRCRIDRRRGLPIDSHIEQSLEMTVKLADGTEFDQFKSTVTTLETRAASDAEPAIVDGGRAGSRPARPQNAPPTAALHDTAPNRR